VKSKALPDLLALGREGEAASQLPPLGLQGNGLLPSVCTPAVLDHRHARVGLEGLAQIVVERVLVSVHDDEPWWQGRVGIH
jgi:hypothetical protein